jgi:hypothetical protein
VLIESDRTQETGMTFSTPYPQGTIYVAHRLFTGEPFKIGGEWGDVLDGPLTDIDDVADKVRESFKAEDSITYDVLRVLAVRIGKDTRDVTVEVLTLLGVGE